MSNGWTPSSPCAPPTLYLPLSGGTMTGPLILAADPVQDLEAATKQYVDQSPLSSIGRLGDNRIINGDMRIDQRNNHVAQNLNNVFTADRWTYSSPQTGKLNWQANQNSAPVLAATGFSSWLAFVSTSAYTALATDAFMLIQSIEADMVTDFAWGTASAQPVTLSFWFNSSIAGTYSGAVANYAGTRSYPFTFAVSANIWTKIVVTIPGDTGGTWVMSGNGGGVNLRFDLGSGANWRAPAGAWASGNYIGANGAASIVAVNGAGLNLTGVKLEIGSTATPYNRQSLAKSMADCQRYYQKIAIGYRSYLSVSATVNVPISWLQMRAAPTCTLITAGTRSNSGAVALSAYQENSGFFQLSPPAAGDAFALNDLWSLAAEL